MNFYNEFFIMSGLIDIPEKKLLKKKVLFKKFKNLSNKKTKKTNFSKKKLKEEKKKLHVFCITQHLFNDDTLIPCETIITAFSNKCNNKVIIMDLRWVVRENRPLKILKDYYFDRG